MRVCACARTAGLVSVDIASRAGFSVPDLLASEQWAWVDPGVFATVGAGAFLGGALMLPAHCSNNKRAYATHGAQRLRIKYQR